MVRAIIRKSVSPIQAIFDRVRARRHYRLTMAYALNLPTKQRFGHAPKPMAK